MYARGHVAEDYTPLLPSLRYVRNTSPSGEVSSIG